MTDQHLARRAERLQLLIDKLVRDAGFQPIPGALVPMYRREGDGTVSQGVAFEIVLFEGRA